VTSNFHGGEGIAKTNGPGEEKYTLYGLWEKEIWLLLYCNCKLCQVHLSWHLGATTPIPPINDAPTAIQSSNDIQVIPFGARSMVRARIQTMYYEFNCNAGINPKLVAALDWAGGLTGVGQAATAVSCQA
jgi:hypothetical protein